jgi:hypothetical protein
VDYRLACQLGGTNDDNLIICNLPLFLSDAARAWLEHLPPAQISNWDDLVKAFAGNFQGTYVHPRNSWDLRSCRQQLGESLREYIRRFSKQRTELPNITDSDVIGAFLAGTTCRDLVSKLGRKTHTKASELMDIATKFASGQEAVEAIFRKDKQPQGRQKEDALEASAQRGMKKKAKKKAQAKRDTIDADLITAVEHRNPRKPPGGVNTFDKKLKESCPYHRGPVKHTLEECNMLRCYFIKAGPSVEGGKDQGNNKKGGDKEEEFPEVRDCFMIYDGQVANASARHRKQERREVCSVKVAAPVYLDWSDKPITFDQGDHPDCVPSPGRYPLVVDPVIGNARLTKVLMDGGSSLNIIYAETLGLLGIDLSMIRAGAAPFHGIVLGKRILPLGQLDLPVCFGTPSNFRKETLTFEVVGFRGTYHAVLGRPCYASSWPSPTTHTSSSRCQAPMEPSPSDPRTATLTSATWNAWSTLRPSLSPRPSSLTWIASPRRHLMRSTAPATSNRPRRSSPSPSTTATTPARKSGSAPSSTPNRKQCSSTLSAQMPNFLRGVPRTCQAYRGMHRALAGHPSRCPTREAAPTPF